MQQAFQVTAEIKGMDEVPIEGLERALERVSSDPHVSATRVDDRIDLTFRVDADSVDDAFAKAEGVMSAVAKDATWRVSGAAYWLG